MYGATPNQVNPRTGYRNWCYGCGSDFRLLPHGPGIQPDAVRRVAIAVGNPDEVGGDVLGGDVYAAPIRPDFPYSGSARHSAVIFDTGWRELAK